MYGGGYNTAMGLISRDIAKGGRQSCQFSKPQLKMDFLALRIISQQKFLVGAFVMT